jgi:hypothetical protein
MKLNEAFERVCLISLSYREDRLKRVLDNLNECGLATSGELTHLQATSGNRLGSTPAWFGGGRRAWGCLLSHLRAVEQAAHDDVDSVLILEDEVFFHQQAANWLGQLMSLLPSGWGQLYLGGQHLKDPTEIGGVLKCANVNRTHAYALYRSHFGAFITHILQATDYLKSNETRKPGEPPKIITRNWRIDHQLGAAHTHQLWPTYAP